VTQVAEAWLELRRGRRKPETYARYGEVLRSRILPRFGALPVPEVTEEAIQAWVTSLVDEGLSPRRVNFLLGRLKSILKTKAARLARKAAGVEDPTVDVAPLEEPEVEIDPLAPDEIRAFLDACPAWWRPYFTVAFGTGARPGELAALKRGDLDLRAGQFRIRATRATAAKGRRRRRAADGTSTSSQGSSRRSTHNSRPRRRGGSRPARGCRRRTWSTSSPGRRAASST
jgi:integrase